MLKAMYMNDYQWKFIDDQEKLIFSFRSSNRPIMLLDIRKLQLASMLKGEWCKSFEEIASYLSSLHQLDSYWLGRIVEFFKLFDNNYDDLINHLPSDIWESISNITTGFGNLNLFLIEGFENCEFLSHPIEGFHPRWLNLKRGGIYTIGDLTNLTKSELLHVRNIGPKIADELEALLAEKGYYLKEEKK